VPDDNPAAAVYGLVAVGALLAAESGQTHESYLDMVASAAIAAVTYWMLHAYATLLGRRLTTGGALTVGALLRALGHDVPLLRGAAIPLVTLFIAWLVGATQEHGLTAALWSVVAAIVAFELLAGVRARSTPRELGLQTVLGLLLGLGVLSVRMVVH
jgi:hypothetical protein